MNARLASATEAPIRVLLVEDDAGDAVLVEAMIEDSGLPVALTWTRSLREARTALARETPDCVLLDLHLGDAQGLAALAAVRSAASAAVIVLTGLAETESGLAAVAAGAQDYLVKGQLDPHGLGRAIRYAVQRKQVELHAAELQAIALRAEEEARLERGLLPRPLIDVEQVSVVPRYRPGREFSVLGGDFYDVVQMPDGAVHAVIGDVAGHGPAEAALGVCLRVAWRSLVLAGMSGVPMLRLLEQLLIAERDSDDAFVTLTSLVLAPDRSSLVVVRAGHPGMLMREQNGKVGYVQIPGGLGLGMIPGSDTWEEHRVPLPPGARVVLFTDGVFEGQVSADGRRLDIDGLLGLALELAHLPDEEFVDVLIERAEAASAGHGGLDDDVAVIQVGWRS